jgi:hypothetical protein
MGIPEHAWICASMTSSFRQKRAVRRQHEPGRKDLAPVIDRGQLQIITAGLVPPGSHGSGITGHSGPPARRGHA